MKKLASNTFFILFLSHAHAANPVCGWYGGLILGGTYQPKVQFSVVSPFTNTVLPATLSYSASGDLAIQSGYRYDNFRVEGELMGTGASYKSLQIGQFTITHGTNITGYTLKGTNSTFSLMANLYYDIYARGPSGSDFYPYVGFGVGAANVRDNVKLYYNDQIVQNNTRLSKSTSTAAAQGILGVGYFMDDYASIGLDYRYFTTQRISLANQRHIINSINIVFNGTF